MDEGFHQVSRLGVGVSQNWTGLKGHPQTQPALGGPSYRAALMFDDVPRLKPRGGGLGIPLKSTSGSANRSI